MNDNASCHRAAIGLKNVMDRANDLPIQIVGHEFHLTFMRHYREVRAQNPALTTLSQL